jgi:FG-GAP-like repeat/Trypsin
MRGICRSVGLGVRGSGAVVRRAIPLMLPLLFVLLTVPGSASAGIHPLEVREYRQDFGVSKTGAESALSTQNRGARVDILGQLESGLGEDFAGVWFDNKTGEFVVPTLSGAERGQVQAALAADGLGGEYRTVRARSSWNELEAAHERLDRALLPLLENGKIQTSLDPRTGAVVIDVAQRVGRGQQAKIRRVAAGAGVKVEVRERGIGRFGGAATGCTEQLSGSLFICGKPLRGGVRLEPSGTTCCQTNYAYCTAGFKAIGNTYGNRFILTAGHCVTSYADFMSFDSDQFSQGHYIGHVEAASFPGNDYAAINANGSYWDTSPWPSKVAYWGTDQERAINYESSSYMGEYVCHSGARTGASCGTVTGLDKTITFQEPGTPTIYHLTAVQGFCAYFGDSGGPVFAGNTALGIFSGTSSTSSESGEEKWAKRCSYEDYYSEITNITSALGVTVGTGTGAPPYAETWDADNSFGTQVTGHGKVDPNGMPTTWRFEYGTTSSYGSATESYYAGAGMGPVNVSATISGLQPGTTYHYRISSSNGLGQSNGADKTFKANGYRYMLGTSTGTTIGSWNSVLGEMSRPAKMGVGDFTGDKKADIVSVESEGGGKYRYMLGTSNGSGIASWSTLLTGLSEQKLMEVGDVTGDGKADVVSVESEGNGNYRYMLGISTGTGISWNHFALTGMSLPTFMKLGDVNGDGKADVVSVESEGNGKYRYMLGISNGSTFSWGFTSLTGMSGPWSVAVGDVTGDKKADIVAVEDAGGWLLPLHDRNQHRHQLHLGLPADRDGRSVLLEARRRQRRRQGRYRRRRERRRGQLPVHVRAQHGRRHLALGLCADGPARAGSGWVR